MDGPEPPLALNGLKKAARRLSRPVRFGRGAPDTAILPYRGYGTAQRFHVTGRVFRQPTFGAHLPRDARRWYLDLLRRFLRRGLGDRELVATCLGTERRIRTDRYGYFDLQLNPARQPPADRLWHRVDVTLIEDGRPRHSAYAEVYVPPPASRFVVISDIDDTVVLTGVGNALAMMWRMFVQNARARTAFPGVSALYRGLHGRARNPILYVSRGPWSLYEVLGEFFEINDIPVGPILFLRDWGLTLQHPLPRRARDHKLALIRQMLQVYDHLPVLLIGDSGQHDPEMYARIVAEHPGRVMAVYIRDVSRSAERDAEMAELSAALDAAGSGLVVAQDSLTFARHAAASGWLSADALREVAADAAARAAPG